MKKWCITLTLFVASTVSAHTAHMQSVSGIASDLDANRHYLDHVGMLQTAAGVTSPADSDVTITAGVAFHTWYMNAIQGFNDVQSTLTDPTAEATALANFVAEVDSEVSSYMAQLQSKLSPMGRKELASYIKSTQPKIKSGISQSDYNKYFKTDAEYKSQLGNGGGGSQGTFNCSHGLFTCSATYSVSIGYIWGVDNVYDYFNRGNGPLGSNWTADTGTFAVSSDTAVVTSGGSGGTAFTRYTGQSFNADQYAQVNITSLPTTGASIGLTVRESSSSNAYFSALYNGGSWYGVITYKIVGGTVTQLGSVYVTPSGTNNFLLQVSGPLLTAWFNSVEVAQYKDTSLTSGYPGMAGTTSSGSVDNFQAGNVGSTMLFNPIVDGGVTMSSPPVGQHHTGVVHAWVNGVEQSYAGSSVCQTCYIYSSNVFQVPFLSGQTETTLGDEGDFECTFAGDFFDSGTEYWLSNLAHTVGQNIDQNHSGGGPAYPSPYQWYYPNNPFFNGNGTPGSYLNFTTTNYGYGYQLANYCSNLTNNGRSSQTPDADLTNFKAVMPTIFLVGGTWNTWPVPVQGGVVDIWVPLFRLTSTSTWTAVPPYLITPPSLLNADQPWNSPAQWMVPQLTTTGWGPGICDATFVGSTTPYSTKVTNSDKTISGH